MGETCVTDGEGENFYGILVNKSEGKGQLDDLGIGGSLILKCMDSVAISCVHDN
jgi:hypothetical protein